MDRTELQQEIESLDAESRKVAEMLGSLKRVEAPSNFEFGIRARIANGAPAEKWSLVPILKVAAPLSLVLIVAMSVIFYQTRPQVDTAEDNAPRIQSSSEASSTIARSGISNNSEPVPAPSTEEPVSLPPAQRGLKPVLAQDGSNPDRRPSTRGGQVRPSSGTSEQFLLRPANTINPPEFRPGNQKNANSNTAADTDIPVREILEMIGVVGDPTDGGWKVSSTKEGSLAHKSGVRSGDVIEAIDGRAISAGTKFQGPSGGRTLRVLRNGKSLDVKLTN